MNAFWYIPENKAIQLLIKSSVYKSTVGEQCRCATAILQTLSVATNNYSTGNIVRHLLMRKISS